jgi:hypothetical protein
MANHGRATAGIAALKRTPRSTAIKHVNFYAEDSQSEGHAPLAEGTSCSLFCHRPIVVQSPPFLPHPTISACFEHNACCLVDDTQRKAKESEAVAADQLFHEIANATDVGNLIEPVFFFRWPGVGSGRRVKCGWWNSIKRPNF